MMDLTGGVGLSGGLHSLGNVRESYRFGSEVGRAGFLVLGRTGFALVRNFFSLTFFSFFLLFFSDFLNPLYLLHKSFKQGQTNS
jgi:hypothetical protein